MRSVVCFAAVAAALISFGGVARGGSRSGEAALEAPAFSAPAADLLALAKRVKVAGDPEVVMLLQEGNYRIDRQGRETVRLRRIFAVRTPAALHYWDTMRAEWSLWYQHRPEMRARVILPDGTVQKLDPKTISVSPDRAGGDHSYSDDRSMRAPLPALQVGAVVEEELVVRDARPYFRPGISDRFGLVLTVPIHEERVTITAPRSLPVRSLARLGRRLHLRARRSRRRGWVSWRFAARSVAAWHMTEPGLPPDRPRYPYIAFSTGRSWRRVARAYAGIVTGRIAADSGVPGAKALPKVAGKSRDAVIRAAAAKVRKIRYTGLEFGQRAIVPWPPAETWRRKYGDCKDKATLLVALLRRAGIRADVALLRSGFGADVDPALPGLSRFDHAIVYVPGRRPVWIDPTADLARPGELPTSDQGRWALIAAPTTRRLVRTPVAPSRANRDVEVREVRLPDKGLSRIVEHTTLTGYYARDYRRDYRDIDADRVRKHMVRYVKSEYRARKLVAFTHDDPEKLAPSFHLTVTAGGCRLAESDRAAAHVFIRRSDLLEGIPYELRSRRRAPRKSPLAVAPYQREIDYRIEVPPGFSPRPLPPDFVLKLGPLSLRGHFAARPHLVLATLRFDMRRRRLTAAEVNAVRAAIKKLRAGQAIELVFDQVGVAALDAGDIGKAVGEFRRLSRLEPRQPLHRRRLAVAYLDAGLGAAARTEARRALALGRSAGAYGTLGWVLQHDALGRDHYPGADRRGAIRAYRRGLALKPKSKWLRGNLAILLAYGPDGDPYGGDLSAAIKEFRRLHREGYTKYDVNLMRALLRAGRFQELRAFARSLPASSTSSAYRLAAAAALGGAAAREREYARLPNSGAERRKALLAATGLLETNRYYELAADTLRAVARGAREPAALRARARFLASVRRRAHLHIRANDPRGVVREFLAALAARPRRPRAAVAKLLSRQARAAGTGAGADDIARSFELGYSLAPKKVVAAFPPAALADLATAAMKLQVEAGPPGGWHVEVKVSQYATAAAATAIRSGLIRARRDGTLGKLSVFVVKERGRMRILASGADRSALAAEALALAQRGKLAAARKWIAWAAPTMDEAEVDQWPFFALWRKGHRSSRRDIELAAASLLQQRPPLARRAIRVLRRCPRGDKKVLIACDEALAFRYLQIGKLRRAFATLERVRKRARKDPYAVLLRRDALPQTGHLAEAEVEAKKALAADADDGAAQRELAMAEMMEGDFSAAVAELRRITAGDQATADDFNNLAWNSLLAGRSGDDVLAAANRAVTMSDRGDEYTLNTLACVHAARGEYHDAYQAMLKSMKLRGVTRRAPKDWLVIGRIAAGLGLRKRALAAYAKAAAAPDAGSPDPVATLAARWKRALRTGQGATTVAVPVLARVPRNCADWRSAAGTSNTTKWPSEPLACWY